MSSHGPGPGAREFPPHFVREYGCDMADWQRWIPQVAGEANVELIGEGHWRIAVGTGHLLFTATALAPRVIALIRLPRMQVRFEFVGLDGTARNAFMRRFDLTTQRGGG